MGVLSLRTHLFGAVVLPLVLGMTVCVLVAIIPLYNVIHSWNDNASIAVQEMTVAASAARTMKMNENLQVLYSQLGQDLGLLRNMTYAALEEHVPVQTYYPTYYGTMLGGVAVTLPPQEDRVYFSNPRTGAGFEQFSAALLPGARNMADVLNATFAQRSSLIDPVLKALYKTNRGGSMSHTEYYLKLMMGFENSFYRRYPFPSASGGFPLDYTDGTVAYCDSTLDPSFVDRVAYHPQCRPWYHQAKLALMARRQGLYTGQQEDAEITVYSTPYVDAATKAVTISASTPIVDRLKAGAPFVGVVNIDFNMSAIEKVVRNVRLASTGYFFIMDSTGVVISHPRFFDRSVTSRITDFENNLTPTILLQKQQQEGIQVFRSGTSGVTYSYMQPSDSTTNERYIFWTTNIETGYILVGILPRRDLTSANESALRELSDALAPGTIALSILLVVLFTTVVYQTNDFAGYYASALQDASIILSQMSKPDLQAQRMIREPVCYELDLLFRQFKPMLVAINFGNDSFYDGKLDKALADYVVAEELMTRSKNSVGLAKVHNNKGNVFLKQRRFAEAEAQYMEAIQLGEQHLRSIEDALFKVEHQLSDLMAVRNNSHDSAGVVVRQGFRSNEVELVSLSPPSARPVSPNVVVHIRAAVTPPNVDAETRLIQQKRCLQDERVQTRIVIAKRQSNLGVLYKNQGRHAQAYMTLQQAIDMHQSADNDLGMAQVSSNLAQFYLEDGQIGSAQSLIDMTYRRLSTVSESHQPEPYALQYATMTLGLLCQRQGRSMDAAGWLQYTLGLQETHSIIDAHVQEVCFEMLVNAFATMGNHEMASKYRRLRHRHQALKDVLFALDISGSMQGDRITRCRASIKTIVSTHIDAEDRVGLVTFNHQTRRDEAPLQFRGWTNETIDRLMYVVDHNTQPTGGTAFWDALITSISELHSTTVSKTDVGGGVSASSVAVSSPSIRNHWLISLTDGEDGHSNNTPDQVCRYLTQHPVHLVIITVGSSFNRDAVRRLVATAKEAGKQGHHIASETDSIDAAFQSVAKLITHQLNVESM